MAVKPACRGKRCFGISIITTSIVPNPSASHTSEFRFDVDVGEESSRGAALSNKARIGAAAAFHLDLRHAVSGERTPALVLQIVLRIIGLVHRWGGIIITPLPLERRRRPVIGLVLGRRQELRCRRCRSIGDGVVFRDGFHRGAVHESGENSLRLGTGSARIKQLREIVGAESAVAAWSAVQERREVRARGGAVPGKPGPGRLHILTLLGGGGGESVEIAAVVVTH